MGKRMSKDIEIAYDKPVLLPISELNDFQGDLKELSDDAFAKLSGEIMRTGFAFAPHVWRSPKDKKWYLVDGHQRIKTVRRMMHDSGFRVPKIPAIPVKAATISEAKRRVLQAASQYGEITQQGLFNFTQEAKIDFKEVSASFDFPTIDMSQFSKFFEAPPPEAKDGKKESGGTEIEQGQFTKMVHECPQCGHKFARE